MASRARRGDRVPHEITIIALARDEETGNNTIFDIIETSNHFAYSWTRRFMRDIAVHTLVTLRPGESLLGGRYHHIR